MRGLNATTATYVFYEEAIEQVKHGVVNALLEQLSVY